MQFLAEEWAQEFIVGARALNFEPSPQQWTIANVLNSHREDGRAIYNQIAVCVPRRAGKTTVILALAIGRCLLRDDYHVLFTAQSGTKASARFLQMARDLERVEPDADIRGFRILRGAGNQCLLFTNGSVFQVLTPKPDAFRGDAADLIILDEAQEHTVEDSAELMGAILPTMDTRPGAQVVVAGTAGERRSGLFWDSLEEGRQGLAGAGIVEYAAPDGTEPDDAGDEELWQFAHPGIGTLTDLETIRQRFERLPKPQFMREYLGIWPEDYTRSVIDMDVWRAAQVPLGVKPAAFALGFDVAPDQSSSAIAAAWRENDVVHVEIVDHRQGVEWLSRRVVELAQKYRVPVAHDTIGATLAEAEVLARSRPRPQLRPQTMRDLIVGCQSFMRELNAGRLKHFDQPSLTEAVRFAAKRTVGENAWLWGRRLSAGDITPLVAATLAIRALDNTRPAVKLQIVTPAAS